MIMATTISSSSFSLKADLLASRLQKSCLPSLYFLRARSSRKSQGDLQSSSRKGIPPHRTMATTTTMKALTVDNINQHVRSAQYAVRGVCFVTCPLPLAFSSHIILQPVVANVQYLLKFLKFTADTTFLQAKSPPEQKPTAPS